jgi:purine-binding chemotaxis protein CheW
MDIAKIRKKAKKQSKLDENAPENKVPSDFGSIPDSPEDETVTNDAPVVVEPEAIFEPEGPVSLDAADGLDRLFGAAEEFALSTDESCDDLLEVQTDSHGRLRHQYLAFRLADEEYALDIKQISEIIKVREFTDIPRAPGFILGIISLRGVVVPVFDLRQRLGLGLSEVTALSRIVVCRQEDVTVGLMVDSINQVVNLYDEEVEPPPGVLSGLDRDMVSGLGRCQGRMIILLNLHSVLDVETSI